VIAVEEVKDASGALDVGIEIVGEAARGIAFDGVAEIEGDAGADDLLQP
jgi:hypothetical protein